MSVRWWNRVAAWICEHLHDAATPVWIEEGEVSWDADDPMQRVIDDAYREGRDDGFWEARQEAGDP